MSEWRRGQVGNPVCAFHGLTAAEHEFGRCLFCCICLETLTPDRCYVDAQGDKWDMCFECGLAEEGVPTEGAGAN